jgi:redox-sensing transcriptional repressor
MRYHRIPDETVRRLPVYLRALTFNCERGLRTVSSRDLADLIGANPWQIRKDLSYFGDFGTRGVGYDTEKLAERIKKILKLKTARTAALVGVGNLGAALLAYPGFAVYGFDIAAAFDANPKKIGTKIHDIRIESASQLHTLGKRGIDIAITAVPAEAAQQVADRLVEAVVRAILNFSPCYLAVPKRTKVISIDIATYLARLPYYMPSG